MAGHIVLARRLLRQPDVHQLVGHTAGVPGLPGDPHGYPELLPGQPVLLHAAVHDARVARCNQVAGDVDPEDIRPEFGGG